MSSQTVEPMSQALLELPLPSNLMPRAEPSRTLFGDEIVGDDNPPGSGIYQIKSSDGDVYHVNTKPFVFNNPRFPEFRDFLRTAFSVAGTKVLMLSRFRIFASCGIWDGKTDDLCAVMGILDGLHMPYFEPNYSNGGSAVNVILGLPFSRYVTSGYMYGGSGYLGLYERAPCRGPLLIAEEGMISEHAFHHTLTTMLWEKAFPETAKPISPDVRNRFAKMYIGDEEIDRSPFADRKAVLEEILNIGI